MVPRPLGSTTATRLSAGSGPGQSYMMKTTVACPLGFNWPAVGAGAGAPASMATAPGAPGAHGTPISLWRRAPEPPEVRSNWKGGVPSSRYGVPVPLVDWIELYRWPAVAAPAFA